MKKVKISNIKNVQNLEFEIPSESGVYVLTGSNGSGKTTLMTCLLRIGWFRAFQDNFRTGSERIDKFNGYIEYFVDNTSVKYIHGNQRWVPTPRNRSTILRQFGFPDVRFLPATGNRLYIHDQNITPTDFRSVNQNLKDDLNSLLETEKFDNLRYIQTGSARGRGSGSQRWKRAYVIKHGNDYYSEKNFSLGEILVLNTLLLIEDVPSGSMLLIDELEMALHPKVQIKLLRYLETKAREKNLIVILSTHSSSIIKCAENIMYLKNSGGGNITVLNKCYPAIVLREVAIEEDIQPDYIFLVEDDMAKLFLEAVLNLYFQYENTSLRPICKILPIGGYPQVLSFADNTREYLFNNRIGQYLFLDKDVEQVKSDLARKGNNRTEAENSLFDLFSNLERRIKILPITPELGLWNWIISNSRTIQNRINSHYPDATFGLDSLISQTNSNFPHTSNNERTNAKNHLAYLVRLLENNTNEHSKRISQFLFGLFVESYFSDHNNLNALRNTFGQIFNTRGNPRN